MYGSTEPLTDLADATWLVPILEANASAKLLMPIAKIVDDIIIAGGEGLMY